MQSTTSTKTIDIKLKDKSETLSIKTYARWLCLIEAIELVCTKAKQIKVDTNNNMDWIKPLAFQKYIEERFESMVNEIEINNNPDKNNLNTHVEYTLCNTHQEQALK